MRISKIDFPTLPDRGASFAPELTKEFAAQVRTMSLDKLQASLAANGVKPADGGSRQQSAAASS